MFRRWGWLAMLLAAGCGGSPQLGTSNESYGAVDALFTAVTARRPALLDRCEDRLRQLREDGKLPAPAAARLEGIVAEARSGEWEPAARKLAEFIRGQRRE